MLLHSSVPAVRAVGLVWALQREEDKPVLVPLHTTRISLKGPVDQRTILEGHLPSLPLIPSSLQYLCPLHSSPILGREGRDHKNQWFHFDPWVISWQRICGQGLLFLLVWKGWKAQGRTETLLSRGVRNERCLGIPEWVPEWSTDLWQGHGYCWVSRLSLLLLLLSRC